MEVVESAEAQLVGRPAGGGEHVEVVELVGGAAGGGVNEALPVGGEVGAGPIEALLLQDGFGLAHARSFGRHAPHVPRSQWDAPIGEEEQFFPVRAPGGLNVHVPFPEIEAAFSIGMVPGEGDGRSGPAPLPDGTDMDVEVPVGLGGNVGQPVPVRGKSWIGVEVGVVGQSMGLPRFQVQDLKLNGAAAVVGGVDDPPAVGGPVGRRVVVPIIGQLEGFGAGQVNPPDGAMEADGDLLAVRRPGGSPRGRGRRRRQVIVEHVAAAVPGGRIGPAGAGRCFSSCIRGLRLGGTARGSQDSGGKQHDPEEGRHSSCCVHDRSVLFDPDRVWLSLLQPLPTVAAYYLAWRAGSIASGGQAGPKRQNVFRLA